MQEKRLLIVAGEASGDLNASLLVKSLKERNPSLKISGVGGRLMQQAGVEIYCDIEELAVLGLFDVLKKLPKFNSLKNLILKKIKELKPLAIILVDFSGFNLRLAKAINLKVPTIYYVSPQVWASRQKRIETIRKYISKMIVLFEFEKRFYQERGINVDFVGHPLLDIVRPKKEKEEFMRQYHLVPRQTYIALLPGSRKAEILHILPIMLRTAVYIKRAMPQTQFILAKSPNVKMQYYTQLIQEYALEVTLVEEQTYDCLNIADFCLVASGTATLETAIMQKPFLIIYRLSWLNYFLYRPQVKLEYIGMVNIVAGKKIIPEFIQYNARPRVIADYVVYALGHERLLAEIKNSLAQIRTLLGEGGASARAAEIILKFLQL